ncbi:MAG: 4Fe-4S dicluster domain-containing protein, partial [Nitrospinota bacterium]|nr:4Fe-4S dicluster domain-containing protein [Nitrospinota bacterium]
AGPANMALAYRLVQLADRPIKIAVLEKAKEIGGHLLSGAVSNPRVIEKLFPQWKSDGFPHQGICSESYLSVLGARRWENVPSLLTPPYFKKEGYAILNISEMAAYIASKTTEAAAAKPGVVVDFFPGFPAQGVLYDGNRVAGVQVDNTGNPDEDNLYAKVTVFGDKGFVSRDLIGNYKLRKNPQIWSVGVKEVWETPRSHEGKVWHTLGYPLAAGAMGGGFVYGQKNNRLVIGMVVGLDFENPNIRPPQLLQDLKKHPYVQEMIRGGSLLKYGAAVLPEGGMYSLPEKFAVDGAMLVGDALGVLDVKRFSGVDKAMESGYQAAETIWMAMGKDDFSAGRLADYQERLMSGWVGDELRDSRYFRKAFIDYPELLKTFIPRVVASVNSGKSVVYAGIQAGMANPFGSLGLLGARKMIENPSNLGPAAYKEDRTHIKADYLDRREISEGYVEATVYTTADVVFYAHTHYGEENRHIEEFDAAVCEKCIAEFDAAGKDTPCVGDCTAEVHQTLGKDGKRTHAMALENCVQCTTCEIVCPKTNLRVRAALRGYGPDFTGM